MYLIFLLNDEGNVVGKNGVTNQAKSALNYVRYPLF
jgi:hypothetical protein